MAQIHSQNNLPANVRTNESADRPAFHEAVGGGVWRNLVEDGGEDLALYLLEPRLWRFDQTDITGSLG